MATYQPYYSPTDWKNLPSTSTPLNRTNLYHSEQGIKEADNRIVGLSNDKAENALVNTLVKSVSLDTDTGILAVKQQNGSTATYDLAIEQVVVNFDINDNNELVLTLADGTQKVIDLTRFVYSVASTSTVAMKTQNRIITAEIVDGSVTMEKLDAAIQEELRQYMLDAEAARDAALQYQKFSKRYALGDEEFIGSDIDNAKYYYEQSKLKSEQATKDALTASTGADTATTQAGIATQKAVAASQSATSAAADAGTATSKAQLASNAAADATEQANISTQKASQAQTNATSSDKNAKLSKRYAVGGEVPEDVEDNAKWYYQQSKSFKDEVEAAAKITIPRFYIDFTTGKLMSETEAKGIRIYIENGKLYGEAIA